MPLAQGLHPERREEHRGSVRFPQSRRDGQGGGKEHRGRLARTVVLPERGERPGERARPVEVPGIQVALKFPQCALGAGLGAGRERPLPGPQDHGSPPVPAVEGVAVVAHVALVLGLVGRQVLALGCGAHLGVRDGQVDLLAAAAVRAGPPAQRDLVVDQLVQFVAGEVAAAAALGTGFPVGVQEAFTLALLVLAVVVVLDLAVVVEAFVRRMRVPGLLHLGQREDRFAVRLCGGLAEQGGAGGVGSLEAVPVQAALGVLVVEEVHEAVRGAAFWRP